MQLLNYKMTRVTLPHHVHTLGIVWMIVNLLVPTVDGTTQILGEAHQVAALIDPTEVPFVASLERSTRNILQRWHKDKTTGVHIFSLAERYVLSLVVFTACELSLSMQLSVRLHHCTMVAFIGCNLRTLSLFLYIRTNQYMLVYVGGNSARSRGRGAIMLNPITFIKVIQILNLSSAGSATLMMIAM